MVMRRLGLAAWIALAPLVVVSMQYAKLMLRGGRGCTLWDESVPVVCVLAAGGAEFVASGDADDV